MTSAREGKIRLPDGRALAWAEYGDPKGQPLLYCHGFPGSRLEAALADAAARERGWRLFAPDRPGYGRSDHLPGRSLVGWPADAATLADHLGVERFAVLGVSGGAPYALACAARIPERLTRIGLVAPLGPVDTPAATAGMALLGRFFLALFRRTPAAGHLLLAPLTRLPPERLFALFTATVPATDRAALARPGVRDLFVASLAEAFRQGSRGAARELTLYSRPWGFDPAAIRLPVYLWHGEGDITVPAAMGHRLARAIPGCRATFLSGEGHFSLPVERMEEILAGLVSPAT
jgi:pimeloyl-ACP methyl ester carboxylesterase